MTEHLEETLNVAKNAAEQASEVLIGHYGKVAIMKKNSSQNLVTQADLEAEEIILRRIHQSFPDHKVLREEGESTGTVESKHLWIIDPLDGTNNYAHGIPQFGVSIAYAEQGQVLMGVVLDPNRGETFAAIRGKGAYLNGQRIATSGRSQLNESMIATGFYYDRGQMMEQTLESIRRLFQENIHGIRRFGGAAIDQCWVACGRLEGFFEYQLAPWDYAAASLIIEEAGGQCADRRGAPLRIDSGSVIVATEPVFDQLCSIVRWMA